MDVDNVIFIDSLSDAASDTSEDSDLDEIDPSKRGLIFLPDIDKKLTRIPAAVLTAGSSTASGVGPPKNTNQDLVLYSTPTSLTVSEERDGVRRAIAEWKQRIREKLLAEKNIVGVDGLGGPQTTRQPMRAPFGGCVASPERNGTLFFGGGGRGAPAGDISDADAMEVEL
jgi:hypothetical protein